MMKFLACYICLLFFTYANAPTLSASESCEDSIEESQKTTEKNNEVPSIFSQGIQVDLRNPSFSEGVLSTECGGVISGPDIRIQARRIEYTKKKTEDECVYEVAAEGDLVLEFGEYVFSGDRLEYDFNTKTGVIYNGRTMVEPWFFGGEYVYLLEGGNYQIFNAYATTSPGESHDWSIHLGEACLIDRHFLTAHDVKFRLFGLPVFWLPSFKTDLDTIFDSPIRYTVKWGSRQGHRVGMIYEVFSWDRWKTFLRLDYRLKHGFGGGLETYYSSLDRKTNLETISYVARDSPIIHPKQRFRYRFQGIGNTLLMDDKISVHLSYDKISDIDMPTDYNDRGLALDTAGRTELLIRREEKGWISNFITRARINPFQTLKQELPTLETSWRPFAISKTGIITDNVFKVAYLDFVYGNNQNYDKEYKSSRIEFSPRFYRNFKLNGVNVTPEAGGVFIFYSNSPKCEGAKYLCLGKLSCKANMDFWRRYHQHKHVVTPYVQYDFFGYPTVLPAEPHEHKRKLPKELKLQNSNDSKNTHYVFDIEDGWYRLNMLQFGVQQSLYQKQSNGLISRPLYANLYANAFFDTNTFAQAIPKAYADIVYHSFSFLRHSLNTCWNFNQNLLDFYNFRTQWTISADLAVAAEYRHRSAYDWRKADHTNFILDSFRDVSQLRHSLLSDRRDTLLFHVFYRFHPCWAFQFESRHGWNRASECSRIDCSNHDKTELKTDDKPEENKKKTTKFRRKSNTYNEFEIDLIGKLPSSLNFKLSYQHREDDDRLSVYMSIGMRRPDLASPCNIIPALGF